MKRTIDYRAMRRIAEKHDLVKSDGANLDSSVGTIKVFRLSDLDEEEIDELYDVFKETYDAATGGSWSFSEFESVAWGWTFYGSIKGGVAIRPQRSGLLKLNASYGEVSSDGSLTSLGMKCVTQGLEKLIRDNPGKPIWGVMPLKMAKALSIFTKRNIKDDVFKIASGPLVGLLADKLLQLTSAHARNAKVNKLTGSITVDTPSGRMEKFFIANESYYQWLKDQALDLSNKMVQDVIRKLPGGVNKFLALLPDSKSDSKDKVIAGKGLSNAEDVDFRIDESISRVRYLQSCRKFKEACRREHRTGKLRGLR